MKKSKIFLISKNSNLQSIFNELARNNFLSEKLELIDREDSLLEKILKVSLTKDIYIYDNDFSPSLKSDLFIQMSNDLSPKSKIIILGNDVEEARELINKQVCPFGYINKKEKNTLIVESLHDLILKVYER